MNLKRLPKTQVRELPLFVGLGLENIIVVENEQDASYAVEHLKGSDCLGFDTESKPTFRKGQRSSGPSIIQLASSSKAFIFPTKFAVAIKSSGQILSNSNIKKVGFGIRSDKNKLHSMHGIKTINTEDLSIKLKNLLGDKDQIGARAAVAIMFNLRLAKSAQKSNWGSYPLKEYQLKYAANDAYAALCVELRLSEPFQKNLTI